jgi:hypothetical protein
MRYFMRHRMGNHENNYVKVTRHSRMEVEYCLKGVSIVIMLGTGALLLLAFAVFVVVILLVLLQLTRLGYIVRATIPDRPRRRMFIASISFFITFLGVRLLVTMIVHQHGPFDWVVVGGRHIHHLVWGILILLLVGYGWLLDLGRSHSPISIFFSRLMSVSFGVGAALTLDEFALWLHLEDDYWSQSGRLSIDAVVLFGSLLAIGAWGAPFFSRIQRVWSKRGSVVEPIRRVRLLRPHRFRRSVKRSGPL